MRYKCLYSYDGSQFDGYQKQKNTNNTIQFCLEECLSSLFKQPMSVVGCGRTDKGVSALKACFHFDAPFYIKSDNILKVFKRLRIHGINVFDCVAVDDSFHARYSVIKKHYRYRINCGAYNVLERNYVWQLNRGLDLDLMITAARDLVGRHDFSAFSKNKLSEIPDQVRTIYNIDIYRKEDLVIIDFFGDGFLRYMIRNIVGVLILIGLRQKDVDYARIVLESRSKLINQSIADAAGLMLVEVFY